MSVSVDNAAEPIRIKIKNKPEDLKSRNVSLHMPKYLVNKAVDVTPYCNMLINFGSLNDFKNQTRLVVYIQYAKAPSSVHYDVKLNISSAGEIDINQNNEVVTINSTNNSTTANATVIKRKSNIRILGGSTVVMWDFGNFTYSYINSTKLYFAFSYDGPVPDRIFEENVYTYDEREYRGAFNYSMKTFCSKCSYWSVSTSKWKSEGCKVSSFLF